MNVIVMRSAAMKRCVADIDNAATEDGPVALVGEASPPLAERMHERSRRRERPYVTVDLDAPDVRGTFAKAEREARGGTIACVGVDAIRGELAEDLGRDMRCGRARVVLAVERSTAPLVAELDAALVGVPTLAERLPDIPELARAAVDEAAETLGVDPPSLAPGVIDGLEGAALAGVLEVAGLHAALRRAVVASRARRDVGLADLPLAVQKAAQHVRAAAGLSLAELEHAAVMQAIRDAGGRRGEAAQRLGVSVRTLRRRLHAWGVPAGRRIVQ